MKTTIAISLDALLNKDTSQIDDAIEALKQSVRDTEDKLNEVCRRLAELGMAKAVSAYSGGAIDGNDDVNVTVEPIQNGYKIVADGDDVLFAEYGTGLAAGVGYPNAPAFAAPGTWSKEHGGTFSKFGFWYYNGWKFTETVPRRGIYFAGKEVRERVREIVTEVFR